MLKNCSFQQGYDGSCGPASLKMALHHLGIEKTENELVKLGSCRGEGVELEDLLKIAKKFKIKGFIKENSDLKEIKKYLKKKCAIIVGWFFEDDGHYSVISRIDNENIYLQDPQIGHIRAMRINLFKRIWFDFPGKFMRTKEDLQLRKMLVLYN
ncbi:MAG: cysteine peptidase family C39 domain-containing protein [archaeon]